MPEVSVKTAVNTSHTLRFVSLTRSSSGNGRCAISPVKLTVWSQQNVASLGTGCEPARKQVYRHRFAMVKSIFSIQMSAFLYICSKDTGKMTERYISPVLNSHRLSF